MKVDRGRWTRHWEHRLCALDLEVLVHSSLSVVKYLASTEIEVVQEVIVVISQ